MWPHGGARCLGVRRITRPSLGGFERMLHKHMQLGITDEQRFRFASLMSMAADDAGIPEDPEFRSALVAYLEWGTRLALANSQQDSGHRRACTRASVGLGRSTSVSALTSLIRPVRA